MKSCSICSKLLPSSAFCKKASAKDKLAYRCRKCQAELLRNYHNTPRGRAGRMWCGITHRAGIVKNYEHVTVGMTRAEFVAWAIPRLEDWYTKHPDVTPSVDRKDSTQGYHFGNIRIISRGDNSRAINKNHNVHAPPGYAWCSKCDCYRPNELFRPNKSKFNGKESYCRRCSDEVRAKYKEQNANYARDYVAKNREKVRAYRRAWKQARRAKGLPS